jgi:pre-mRNA-splicing helicase BRR2
MMGKANRPLIDENSFGALFCYGPRRKYYESFLLEPFPIESYINHNLQNHFNAEIVAGTIEEKQDAVDYLTWTFYYRRLPLNPNYYNLIGNSHRHVSDHLSELVDTTFEDLSRSRCVIIEESSSKVEPTNIGRIAAYYYVPYTAIEIFSASLHMKIKQKGILDIICASSDFEDLQIRPEEKNFVNKILMETQMQHCSEKDYSFSIKVNALLYAHFSRIPITGYLVIEQQSILLTCTRLIYALVDIIATEGWLAPLIAAMELSQMVIQGQWSTDSPLLQLPHFSKSLVENCLKTLNIDSIYDFFDLNSKDQNNILSELNEMQLADIIKACNRYPEITVRVTLLNDPVIGSKINLRINLEREWDTNTQGPVPKVSTLHYPVEKQEGWWIVGVDQNLGTVCFMKKVLLDIKAESKGQFLAPSHLGVQKLKLYIMCDSYIGCDHEYGLEFDVREKQVTTI